MLVGLQNKQVSEYWDIFKEVIRQSMPTTPEMLPDRMQRMLFAAMTGRIQCWLCIDRENSFYSGIITRQTVDDLTGEMSLLIYALAVFKKVPREVRDEDFRALLRCAKEWKCRYVSAYVRSEAVVNAIRKIASGGEVIHYVLLPTEGVDK